MGNQKKEGKKEKKASSRTPQIPRNVPTTSDYNIPTTHQPTWSKITPKTEDQTLFHTSSSYKERLGIAESSAGSKPGKCLLKSDSSEDEEHLSTSSPVEEPPDLTPDQTPQIFAKHTNKQSKQSPQQLSVSRDKETNRPSVSEEERAGAGGSPAPSPAAAYLVDYALDAGKIQPESDDYKLVFINSDSSSKGSNSDIEFATDDCDWDYFESTLQQQSRSEQQIQQQLKKETSTASTSLLGSGSFSDPANYTQAYLNRHYKERVTSDERQIPEFHFERYWSGLYGGANSGEFLRWTGMPPAGNVRHPCENCGSDAASLLQGLCTGTNLIPVPIPYPVPVPVPVPFGAEADLAYLDNAIRIKIRSFQPPPPHILLQASSPFGFNWQSILRNENLTQQSTSTASWINTEKAEEHPQPVQCSKPILAATSSCARSEGSVCSEKASQADVSSTIVVTKATNKVMTSREITKTPDQQISNDNSKTSCQVSIENDMVEKIVNDSDKICSESDISLDIESDGELNVDNTGDDTSSGEEMQVATLHSDTQESNNESDSSDSDDENDGHFSRVFVVNPENESETEDENSLFTNNNLACSTENNEITNGVLLKNIRHLDVGEDPGYASELSECIRNGRGELSSSIDDLNTDDTDTSNIIETEQLDSVLHISEDENAEDILTQNDTSNSLDNKLSIQVTEENSQIQDKSKRDDEIHVGESENNVNEICTVADKSSPAAAPQENNTQDVIINETSNIEKYNLSDKSEELETLTEANSHIKTQNTEEILLQTNNATKDINAISNNENEIKSSSETPNTEKNTTDMKIDEKSPEFTEDNKNDPAKDTIVTEENITPILQDSDDNKVNGDINNSCTEGEENLNMNDTEEKTSEIQATEFDSSVNTEPERKAEENIQSNDSSDRNLNPEVDKSIDNVITGVTCSDDTATQLKLDASSDKDKAPEIINSAQKDSNPEINDSTDGNVVTEVSESCADFAGDKENVNLESQICSGNSVIPVASTTTETGNDTELEKSSCNNKMINIKGKYTIPEENMSPCTDVSPEEENPALKDIDPEKENIVSEDLISEVENLTVTTPEVDISSGKNTSNEIDTSTVEILEPEVPNFSKEIIKPEENISSVVDVIKTESEKVSNEIKEIEIEKGVVLESDIDAGQQETECANVCNNSVINANDVSKNQQQESNIDNSDNTTSVLNKLETQLIEDINDKISECSSASNTADNNSEIKDVARANEIITKGTEPASTQKEELTELPAIISTETSSTITKLDEPEQICIEENNSNTAETNTEAPEQENLSEIITDICNQILDKVCLLVEERGEVEQELQIKEEKCDTEIIKNNDEDKLLNKSRSIPENKINENVELHISEDDLESNETNNKDFANEAEEDFDLVPLLDDVLWGGTAEGSAVNGSRQNVGTGATVGCEVDEREAHSPRNTGAYTSYVMITQDTANPDQTTGENNNSASLTEDERVNVSVIEVSEDEVKINHTNSGDELNPSDLIVNNDNITPAGLAGYFTLTLETGVENTSPTPRKPEVKLKKTVVANNINNDEESVQIVTGDKTMSHAVICLEEGLADDDSWVEEVDDADSSNFSESSGDEVYMDREEELRGYHRAIDFTLHTILEESCEESDDEAKPSTSGTIKKEDKTELEKYFFFGLGGSSSLQQSKHDEDNSDTQSESSIVSDALQEDDIVIDSKQQLDPTDLASSRLEKYFLTSFLEAHSGDALSDNTDESGSVGSDSEGKPSPEQRRKKLVRARGTGRHSDRGPDSLAPSDVSGSELAETNDDSTETDSYNDEPNFGIDGLDTVKRKKKKQSSRLSTSTPNIAAISSPPPPAADTQDGQAAAESGSEPEDGAKTPQPDLPAEPPPPSRKHHSRDSGFIGSCDDLLRTGPSGSSSGAGSGGSGSDREPDTSALPNENTPTASPAPPSSPVPAVSSGPPLTITKPSPVPPTRANLTRKDSFNNWSSDEETNLMMCKMRAFFKTMVAGGNKNNNISPAPNVSPATSSSSSSTTAPATKIKPPQLVYFESELTRLMKTVPGIKDEQVREIVEYLSSEDTWSDSYDSSDYTSSDLEGATFGPRTELQQQISASCQEIIQKFDSSSLSDSNDSPLQQHQREDTFVYQRLVASLSRVASNDSNLPTASPVHNSPPLIAKVMHHIGSRLVALMHEVSAAGDPSALLANAAVPSPKPRFRRLQRQQQSPTSSSVDESDSPGGSDTERSTSGRMRRHPSLPRSKSHDLGQWQQLLQDAERRAVPRESLRSSSSGVSDLAEEREDYERFSWRGSFESALAADSRTKLSLEAKRRSTGSGSGSASDLFSSSDQLDRRGRVRSCGSIGSRASLPGRGGTRLSSSGGDLLTAAETEEGLLDANSRRRGSVPDAITPRSTTLPRSNPGVSASTNSLPRLPLSASPVVAAIHKSYSAQLHAAPNTSPHHSPHHTHHHHFLQNVKSARYRPPNFRPPSLGPPKRAVSAPGLHHARRPDRRRGANLGDEGLLNDDIHVSSKSLGAPVGACSASGVPTSAAASNASSPTSLNNEEEDIDRLVALHQQRSQSTLGARSDSMASVYSGAGDGRYGLVAVRGEVEFALQYNYKAVALEILVKQCRDLAPVDSKRMRSDPYVKVYLLPDKSKSGKRKTKVKKHTLNPVFEETLKFQTTLHGLETRTLWLTVWHSDMFGRNDFLGEVRMVLENKVFDDPTPKWYPLQERSEPLEDLLSYKGDIIVALKFIPPDVTSPTAKKHKRSRGALHVLVKEAKNLTAVRGSGSSDPFCKSYLLPDKGRGSKQKTSVAKRTCNPAWNHTFVYEDVSLQELSERSLELTVWDHDRLASNEFLGGLRFNLGTGKHFGRNVDWMDATGRETTLWQNMLERPNFWVEGSLTLRPSLGFQHSSSST